MPTGLEFALAGVLVAFVAMALWSLRRSGLGPAPFWVAGWISAGVSGLIVLIAPGLPVLALLTYPLGTLFPFLLLAGALELAGRSRPRGLVPAALLLGLARSALAAAGHVPAAYGLALAVEPAVALTAAWVVHRAVADSDAGFAHRWLGLSFVALTIAGALHVLWLMLGLGPEPILMAAWMVVVPPTLGLQIYAVADRSRRVLREAHDELERRVEIRTRELADANSALRASEERYRMVSELSSDFSFAFRMDPDLSITLEWITGAFQRIAGVDPEALSGLGWRAFLSPETLARIVPDLEAARPDEHVVRDISIRTPDRGVRRLELRVHTQPTDLPGVLRMYGAARDVTEARRSEAERRELEHHMHESARLESLGRLSGGIAHDFNNLLSVILGNARLAEADLPDGEKVAGRLKRIRAAGEHAALLTDQMLTYAGKAPSDRKVIDVSRSVGEMSELIRAALPEGGALDVDLEPGLRIEADETQIRQIVLNLITNAGEALEEGRGRVELRTARLCVTGSELQDARGVPDLSPGEYVALEVSDSGCGMDAETREHIFDPFFTTKFTGRGMGLASVIGIVRAHGGGVTLDSAPGHGTTARVLLPRVHDEPAVRLTDAAALDGDSHPTGRILVVDDDPDVLEVATAFLERDGFEVVASCGGRDAIDRLRAEPDRFDAVLLDLAMPDVGGEPAFLEMREIRPDLPVILATGFSEEFASTRFKAPGAAGFLRKPYAPEDLVATVRAALRSR